jgi:two-component system, chemotaxis family, chemotaxis protein CheY
MALNILVVDDSALMRSMVTKVLHRSGLEIGEIYHGSNGQEGLHQLEENWIDLVLIDINMPIMDGIELLEAIRSRPDMRDIPVLMVSAESQESRIQYIWSKGAGFVHKPFTPEKLRDEILKTIGVENG